MEIKQAIKSRLNARQLALWHNWRARMPDLVSRALSVLPVDQVVGIREGLQPEGRLDYPAQEIRMQLTSRAEQSRVHACAKEPETVRWLEDNLQPGDVFYDVGANVGAYSLLAARICPALAQVFAIEPSFSTFAALCKNVQLNGLSERITPLQIALTDQTGFVQLNYRDVAPGAANHALGSQPVQPGFTSMYRQRTLGYRLDELIQAFQLPPPSLIKIDVDGGEDQVVRGAAQILSTATLRTVLIEIDEKECPSDRIVSAVEQTGLRLDRRHQRATASVANFIFLRD